MVVLLVTLLFLHQGYTLVPVTTIQLGESVTLRCALPSAEFKERELRWYKQRPGDTRKLIVEVKVKKQTTVEVKFEPEFTDSRWREHKDKKFSHLTIFKTNPNDDGLYHCELTAWTGAVEWSWTYLKVIGNSARISNYTIVQQAAVSSPIWSGDTATLQCSVFFDSENIACSKDLRMFWFQTKSNKTYPTAIYAVGNRRNECEKVSHTEKSCMFQFSKVVNSSDTGIIYCAVASCGKILFGNGTRLEVAHNSKFVFTALVTAITCLVFSFILNIVLMCYLATRICQKQSNGIESTSLQETQHCLRKRIPVPADDGNKNYAMLDFSKSKERREGKKKNRETQDCLYSEVKI